MAYDNARVREHFDNVYAAQAAEMERLGYFDRPTVWRRIATMLARWCR